MKHIWLRRTDKNLLLFEDVKVVSISHKVEKKTVTVEGYLLLKYKGNDVLSSPWK